MIFVFNAALFLREHFTDPDGVLRMLAAYKMPAPKRDAVLKWRLRNSLPAEWLAVLLNVLELEYGKPVSLAPYVKLYKPKAYS